MAFCGKVAVVLLAVVMIGCDSTGPDDTTTTTTSTTTTSVPRANITLTILGAAAAGSGQGNLVGFEFRLRESAGLGANINFVRVDVFRATGQFEERQEIGAGEIVNQTGSNRLGANESRNMTVIIGFRATIKKGRQIRLTVGMTDDAGNDQDKWQDFVFT
jgi:hypothetical protein